ncbi:branched-chain amino acid ABC transporter permease [Loktanella sp. DJP18]|uniref:branched-chain amino acid ABC transporter permease n=1 Tax=Loktanella sp. DJP18 TaxID=3409788 RepID=UPI003BB4C747
MFGIALYLVFFLTVVGIYAIIVMGLNLQWGYTGLFNAGVVAFFAIGAYGTAILSGPARDLLVGGFELNYAVGVAGGMIFAGIAGLIVALATLRLREEYLAIATFGVAISVQLIALNFTSLTGGANGIIGLPRPFSEMFENSNAYSVFFLCFVLAIALIVYIALERAVRSPWGRVLRAIREDEIAALSLGKNPTMIRLQSFVLGSAIMGLAGGIYVGFIGYVSPIDFMPILTFQIWAMLIVGGSGNNRGAVLGCLLVWGLWTASGYLISNLVPPSLQSQAGSVQAMLIGILIVLTLLFRPRGLIGEEDVISAHVGEDAPQKKDM